MTLYQRFNALCIPREVQGMIYSYNIAKKEYNMVLDELLLYYNSGLWWLYKSPMTSVVNSINHIFEEEDTPGKVEFMTYDDSIDIVEQAYNLDEVMSEFQEKIYYGKIHKYS